MICEVCNKEHDGSYGSGRFCSKSCSCKYSSSKRSDECINKIIEKTKAYGISIKKKNQELYESIPKVCKNCGKTFYKNWSKWIKSEFCCKECSRSFSTKEKRDEISKKVSNKLKHSVNGDKEIYKQSVTAYEKNPSICCVCGKVLPYEMKHRKTCSKECQTELWKQYLKEHKEEFKEKGFGGGYRKGSSRGKSGYYKGVWCDSTYELAFLIYNMEHGKSIIRNKERYPYTYKDSNHNYIPDFIVDGELYEIKNFWTELVQVKLECVPKKISIVYHEELEPMMTYIDEKYGTWHKGKRNNYEILYDK